MSYDKVMFVQRKHDPKILNKSLTMPLEIFTKAVLLPMGAVLTLRIMTVLNIYMHYKSWFGQKVCEV